ncbi:MAG: hypothetical protein KJ556_11150 [Gammaproteobacteria bacterium]|nr:hypothetical protein [Gammaproteobacteria bacterium]MBU2056140.1 hypothetical protein [Gammaproteobacteria bacterium]MBU2175674.1 hypothetical protein [Gammaproteobacteria bacterium]MBU2245381.1 hypothetical protein [Gammaproteobacteria bacterium]MBU2345772.1 hypothetical protein [Gammaproteobacteria bacterium]
MKLDCTSLESAQQSLCEIFNATEIELLALLRSVRPFESMDQRPEDVIYERFCTQFGAPLYPIKVTWFHGTRVEDLHSFYKYGILPKTEAKNLIEPRLKELAIGLKRKGKNPFSSSIAGKQCEHDEGPFASLIKDAVVHAPSNHHSYVKAPEIVEDISGELLGENYSQLVNRYQKITKPCVVAFLSNARGGEISHALLYLKHVEDGDSAIDAAGYANTFFCADGEIISPERIQSIEVLNTLA